MIRPDSPSVVPGLDAFRPGEASFMAPAPSQRRATRPRVGAVAKLVLACVGLLVVPLLAAAGSFAVVHRLDRRCPAPVVIRGSIEPAREMAILEQPSGGRP